ncbi:type VII secretion integral membrane protein EccD [Streptomyces sp. SL13]|uniref:Type VII secretion integral membrane protein EccD n=1 Tax=Streptantibioticus silvisoli TaxID=2705255 RepID=A0AA90H8L3_9ACTN|nr:type VII secretion integral membrane protein EccD [Streptantibioticus silvisoli]MDI5965339.1 type VII secretion integral membrane protein EccD [Streptantibioticus silvisoli]MDI5972878.1 type VII secretion integral membrane protein EccD [Streptantibioticus silvisoli]
MSTTAATGFCRITVVAPDSRIDVALPDDIALADIYPEILRLSGQHQDPAAPAGWHLVRTDGTVLDGSGSLAAQHVLDGDILSLRPFSASLPAAVHDDVVDAVASAVGRDHRLWNDQLLRAAGLTAAVLLLALLGLVLWFADPVRHDAHGLPGVVAGAAGAVLTALAAVRARVYRDRGSAVALGLGALPSLLVAGSGLAAADPGHGPGRLQFLIGCAVVLVASALLIALTPTGDAPFVGAAFTAAVGLLAAFAAVLTRAGATEVAAVCAVAAVGAVAFLPALSARFARLPIGYDTAPDGRSAAAGAIDDARIAARARRGHELLLGLAGGCCAVVTVSAGVLGFSSSTWARVLALAVGLAMLSRARLFRYTAQVAAMLTGGILAVALLVAGMALNPPAAMVRDLAAGQQSSADLRVLWLAAGVAAGAALLAAIGLLVPRRGVSPFWGRLLDITEGLVLLSLVPLCLAVLDVYAAVRGVTSG